MAETIRTGDLDGKLELTFLNAAWCNIRLICLLRDSKRIPSLPHHHTRFASIWFCVESRALPLVQPIETAEAVEGPHER